VPALVLLGGVLAWSILRWVFGPLRDLADDEEDERC